jgi:hypothetical protein
MQDATRRVVSFPHCLSFFILTLSDTSLKEPQCQVSPLSLHFVNNMQWHTITLFSHEHFLQIILQNTTYWAAAGQKPQPTQLKYFDALC